MDRDPGHGMLLRLSPTFSYHHCLLCYAQAFILLCLIPVYTTADDSCQTGRDCTLITQYSRSCEYSIGMRSHVISDVRWIEMYRSNLRLHYTACAVHAARPNFDYYFNLLNKNWPESVLLGDTQRGASLPAAPIIHMPFLPHSVNKLCRTTLEVVQNCTVHYGYVYICISPEPYQLCWTRNSETNCNWALCEVVL